MEQNLKKYVPYLGGPASGLLLVAAYPELNHFFLAWGALVPLMLALRGRGLVFRCLAGYLFGVTFFGVLFHWFTLVRYPASLGYVLFLLVFPLMFVPWAALAGWALDDARPAYAAIIPAAAWAVLEKTISYGAFACPWMSISVSQAMFSPVAQIASWGGIYAISFFVVAVNTAICCAASNRLKTTYAVWLVTAAALAAAVAHGAWIPSRGQAADKHPISISLVQANFDQEVKDDAIKRGIDIGSMFKAYWSLSDRAVKDHAPRLIVWPESSLPYEMIAGREFEMFTRTKLAAYQATLISGVYEGNHNSVISYNGARGFGGKYDKIHLVPFGEFVPYRDKLSFTPALKNWIDTKIYTQDLSPGTSYKTLETPAGDAGAMVCFESMLPSISRRLTLAGARFLIVVTNDAWFLRSPAAAQHVALARLRAIENRRWLAQAANTGYSVIIDPFGRVVKKSPLFERTVLNGELYPRTDLTFHTRYGDLFTLLCCIALAVFIPAAVISEKTSARKQKPKKSASKKKPAKKKK